MEKVVIRLLFPVEFPLECLIGPAPVIYTAGTPSSRGPENLQLPGGKNGSSHFTDG